MHIAPLNNKLVSNYEIDKICNRSKQWFWIENFLYTYATGAVAVAETKSFIHWWDLLTYSRAVPINSSNNINRFCYKFNQVPKTKRVHHISCSNLRTLIFSKSCQIACIVKIVVWNVLAFNIRMSHSMRCSPTQLSFQAHLIDAITSI